MSNESFSHVHRIDMLRCLKLGATTQNTFTDQEKKCAYQLQNLNSAHKEIHKKSKKVARCKNHTFCSRGLVENSVVFFAPLVYNAQSEFKQKSGNSNFLKSEAKQIKSVYHRTKIMFPQLLTITEQSPL